MTRRWLAMAGLGLALASSPAMAVSADYYGRMGADKLITKCEQNAVACLPDLKAAYAKAIAVDRATPSYRRTLPCIRRGVSDDELLFQFKNRNGYMTLVDQSVDDYLHYLLRGECK